MSMREQAALVRRSCGGDFHAYCQGVRPGGGRALACLSENQSIAALLARRSRIAAWAAIPAALAGCQLATYFLNQIVLYYHLV